MKRFLLFLMLGVFVVFSSFASATYALVENETWQGNLTGYPYFNAIAFGDIDNDGDQDMIEIGCSSGSLLSCSTADKSRVYINNGTSLIENSTWEQNLTAVGDSSIALGDIDNDGDLDLVLAGGKVFIKIYTNNGTTFTENETWQQEPVAQQSSTDSVTLGDIDNDGDLDLVMIDSAVGNTTFLNNGTAFVGNTTWGQEAVHNTRVSSALVDLDNDNNLDSILVGYDNGFAYINNGTTLELSSIWGANAMDHVSVAIGDIDNDGDMDLIEMAWTNPYNYVLTNNGTELIENVTWNTILGCFYGSLSLGDYNNDGTLDLALTGQRGGSTYSKIYDNNGTTFLENATAEANLTDTQSDSAVWVDIDNDNDLDLIIIGLQKVYINNITTSNTAPTPPNAFNYTYNNLQITLNWTNGSDAETPSTGLYYNLRVGTTSGGNEIVSGVYGGQGDVSGGGGITFGYFGNMMQRRNITIKADRFSESTIYYWSVQTIDTGLRNGSWSAEQNFTTPQDMSVPSITLNAPIHLYNTTSYSVTFNATVADFNLSNVSLYGNWSGGWHRNETNSSGVNATYIFAKDFTASDGFYSWRIEACDNATHCVNSSVRRFTIDGTAPSISSESKSPETIYTNQDATLSAIISDATIGLDIVWIEVNTSFGWSNTTVTSATSIYSYLLKSGNYSKHNNISWRYYANDSFGNRQNGTLQSFTVNNSVPSISGVPDNSTDEDTTPPDKFYNFSLYASDADSETLTYAIQSQSNASLINCSIAYSDFMNCSVPAANQSGSSTIVVNVTDGEAWANDTFIVTVNAVNDVPWASSVNITSSDSLNRTNGTLTGNYTFNDVESASESANETKWYNNSLEVVSLRNATIVGSGNTSKDQNWTFSVRVYDGADWSSWQNSSNFTILNTAPEFSAMANQSWVMNSNKTINLSAYFSDLDNDTLNYTNTTVSNISISISGGIATLAPQTDWNGTRYVMFTANDSEDTANSTNITLSVFWPQFNWTEFSGATTNFSNITSFVNISVIIENPNWGKINFSSVDLNETAIDLDAHVNISENRIEVNSTALSILNESATLYFYNLTFDDPRPVMDGSACSSSICTEVSYSGGTFIYTVTHFTVFSAEETPITPPSNGGGGGICVEKWNCTGWSSCINGTQTRNCTDLRKCGTIKSKPNETRSCAIEEEFEEELCGNGVVDEGENCENCPADVKCAADEECKDGECVKIEEEKKKKARIRWIIYIVLTFVVAVIAVLLWPFRQRAYNFVSRIGSKLADKAGKIKEKISTRLEKSERKLKIKVKRGKVIVR